MLSCLEPSAVNNKVSDPNCICVCVRTFSQEDNVKMSYRRCRIIQLEKCIVCVCVVVWENPSDVTAAVLRLPKMATKFWAKIVISPCNIS